MVMLGCSCGGTGQAFGAVGIFLPVRVPVIYDAAVFSFFPLQHSTACGFLGFVWELFKLVKGVGECFVACGERNSCSVDPSGGDSHRAVVFLCSLSKLKPPPF